MRYQTRCHDQQDFLTNPENGSISKKQSAFRKGSIVRYLDWIPFLSVWRLQYHIIYLPFSIIILKWKFTSKWIWYIHFMYPNFLRISLSEIYSICLIQIWDLVRQSIRFSGEKSLQNSLQYIDSLHQRRLLRIFALVLFQIDGDLKVILYYTY